MAPFMWPYRLKKSYYSWITRLFQFRGNIVPRNFATGVACPQHGAAVYVAWVQDGTTGFTDQSTGQGRGSAPHLSDKQSA